MASLAREYYRWLLIDHLRGVVTKGMPARTTYKAENALERWLVDLANLSPGVPDAIFTTAGLTSEATSKFLSELEKEKIPDAPTKVATCQLVATRYLTLTDFPLPTASIHGSTLTVRRHRKNLVPERLQLLRQSGNDEEIATMVMRYECLLPRGQQWRIPLPVYQMAVAKYGVTVEGFASPLNSQLLPLGQSYCSLFPDTDSRFGSRGSFFNQDFGNTTVLVNPPYIEDLFIRVAEFCRAQTLNGTTFIINAPAWTDATFFPLLEEAAEQTIIMEYGKYYYVDDENHRIPARFNTYYFILRGAGDTRDYSTFQADLLAAYQS